MAKPIYRTDHLVCPLNPGKLALVRQLVQSFRRVAKQEAAFQWQRWHRTRSREGFEAIATRGWSRPWTRDGSVAVTLAQQAMAQVAGTLSGHLAIVQASFTRLVTCSTLAPTVRHQLHALNRSQSWRIPDDHVFRVRIDPNAEAQDVPASVRALARCLIRKSLALHRRPTFARVNPWVDQRRAVLRPPQKTGLHALWLRLNTLVPGCLIELPLIANQKFVQRQEQAAYAVALQHVGNEPERVFRDLAAAPSASSPENQPTVKPEAVVKSESVRAPTVQLLLSPDGRSLQIGLCTNVRALFAHSSGSYRPKTDVLALDLGLRTLFATSEGDLLGRDWMARLEKADRVLTGIARHRQRLGLNVASPRYRERVKRLRAFLHDEVRRVLNRLVDRVKPARIAVEHLDFRSSAPSPRFNRLLRNFGQRAVREHLKEIERRHGIAVEMRQAAYTSQECHRCGYVDARNRPSQSEFACRFCGHCVHADVNAARVLRDRRSVAASDSGSASRRTTLGERVYAFSERFPRARGGPADPRCSNPYFSGWHGAVRSCSSTGPSGSELLQVDRRRGVIHVSR